MSLPNARLLAVQNKSHWMGPGSTVLQPEGSFILWLYYAHQYVMPWIARSGAGGTATADCCCMKQEATTIGFVLFAPRFNLHFSFAAQSSAVIDFSKIHPTVNPRVMRAV